MKKKKRALWKQVRDFCTLCAAGASQHLQTALSLHAANKGYFISKANSSNVKLSNAKSIPFFPCKGFNFH